VDELPYLCSVKKRKQELDLPSFHFPSYLTQAAKGQLQRLDPRGVLRISGLYGSALAPLVAELHGQSPLLVLLRDEEEAGAGLVEEAVLAPDGCVVVTHNG